MSEYNPNHQNAADIPRVSLKQTLEKLFGDEQLQRTKHIQYVADLLISYPTDSDISSETIKIRKTDILFSYKVKIKLSLLYLNCFVNTK